MQLASGLRLGPYTIQQRIGAGGMGIVYRADDARLGRKVAIKILPEASPDNVKRFEREARTIGGLNHPNLLTLFDIGQHEGAPYLVTELLEGETLRTRLSREGKLPVRQAVQIAAEIARGLAAAHGAGVIHRDIKPENIYLTASGMVKILDFGIAKLLPSDVAERLSQPVVATDPTIERDPRNAQTATTATGTMIGTPGYMAPEQLESATVDERTDIFALGVVLYELVSGARAFASASAIEESYAILKQSPEPPTNASPAYARIVMRCLEKRPADRFQSAMDLAFALDEIDASTDPFGRISGPVVTGTHAPVTGEALALTTKQVRRSGRLAWLVAGLALLAIGGVGGVVLGRRTAKPPAPGPTLMPRWPTVVDGGPEYRRVTYHAQSSWLARLAPDGKSAVYTVHRDGSQVVRSQVDQPSIIPLGISGRLADVSARGELAVISGEDWDAGTLSRVFEGAGPRAVADRVTAATWLPDGSLAIVREGTALEYPIGTAIVHSEHGFIDLVRASPTGDRFALVDHPSARDTQGRVIVVDAKGQRLAESRPRDGIEGVAWSPDGSEVWFSGSSTIWGLDPRTGNERVVLRGGIMRLVLVDVRGERILVAPSDLRLKMFRGKRGGPYREIGLYDSSGVTAVSTDGAVVSFVEAAGTGLTAEGYAYFIKRGDQAPALLAQASQATLVPDASAAIAVMGPARLVRVPTGVGAPVDLAHAPIAQLDIGDAPTVSWSGRYAVVRGAVTGGPMKLWRVDLAQPATPAVAIDVARVTEHPVSPDGALVAVEHEAGGVELVSTTGAAAHAFDGPPGERPLSFTGDGAALFVAHVHDDAIEIDRIELASGARTSWVRIAPEQRPVFYRVALDASGELVTYSTNSDSSDLYVLAPPAAATTK